MKGCYFVFHKFNAWGSERFVFNGRLFERRNCLKCGLTASRDIGWASFWERNQPSLPPKILEQSK